jgi:hypothetical protein
MLALTTSACATGADDPGVTERSDTSLPSLPGGGLRSLKPSAPAAIAQELSGVLGFDDIEGGCAYLETDDGTRHQVIYPEGWELQRSPVQLVSPEGQIVARLGDTVTVRGMAAADMASICQIGPMFRATAVELP